MLLKMLKFCTSFCMLYVKYIPSHFYYDNPLWNTSECYFFTSYCLELHDNSLVPKINVSGDWINTFLVNWPNLWIVCGDRIRNYWKGFLSENYYQSQLKNNGNSAEWYLLKGYVRHKSNRKKNCREAAADVRYKSQYQFLCGIQRNISIQVLKQKQKLFSEKRFI